MKKKEIFFAFIVLLSGNVSLGQPTKNTKQKIGITKISLINKLDSLFAQYNNKTSPGFAITIIKDGKLLVKKDYGMASIELAVPFTHQTIVGIPYSEGREFISVAAALLEQDGKLTLEDKVRKYFPKLPAWAEPVTIQDLLNHSSGFCDEWATLVLTQASMNNRLDVSQFLTLLYRQPDPQVEPGRGYMYSNSDFGLLRLILEKASGEKLPDYMQRRIFAPLKMGGTRMRRDKEDVIANHAFSYRYDGPGKYTIWLRDKTSPGGNYQILTTADDLEKWATACWDKTSFIAKAFARLKEQGRPIPVLKGVNFVFGHKVKKIGAYQITTHEGVSGYSYLAQADGLTIICIGNSLDPNAETILTLADYLLHEGKTTKPEFLKLPTTPVTISPRELHQYAGRYYYTEQTFSSYRVKKSYTDFSVVNDSLNWIWEEDDIFPVIAVGKGIFKDPGYPIWLIFQQPHPDSLMRLTFHVQTDKPQILVAKRDTVTASLLSKETIQKLRGRYYSQHLDYYWTIDIDSEGRLVVKRPTVADKFLVLQPDGQFMMRVEYQTDDENTVLIKFHFNDSGEPVYFDVHHTRLMHCRFDKQ
jgi:CubicO group peptidase (beta-lactamase class C family)